MLLNNYSYINSVLGRQFGGLTNPTKYNKPEVMRNYFSQAEGGDIERVKRDSFPTGTNPPYSLVMGPKGGLLSATTTISGSGNISGNIFKGINITATLDGTSTLNASASLIVQLAAAISGGSTLTAGMSGLVQLAANLAGSGNMTAGLSLITGLAAILSGSSSLSGNLKGTADMSANIFVNSGTATTNELVAAIWNAIAADNNNAGTMGQKLNGAGSAGDPWSTNLPASYAGTQAGAILDQMRLLMSELHKISGLSVGEPVTITPTSKSVTGIDVTISGDGVTQSIIERT